MRRTRIVIAIVVLVLFLIPVAYVQQTRGSIKQIMQPVLLTLYEKSNQVRRVARVIRDLNALSGQNEELTAEVSELLAENARLKEVEHENSLLRDELKVSIGNKDHHLVAARISARNAVSFLDIVTIDRGSADKVDKGQAVTLHGSLVGKVITVTEHSAEVQLITSNDAITQAQLQNSRVNGVVRGGIRGLVLELIPQDTNVSPGENVITSGLGGVLRPGIIIGTVTNVVSKKTDIFQSINIKPAAPLSLLDIVFVEVP